MPMYEYVCYDCHTKFEALRPMSQANSNIECQKCKSLHTTRLISMFAAVGQKSSEDKSQSTRASGGSCGCGGSGCCG